MPTYDYVCSNCSKPFEVIRGIRDYDRNPTDECPHCTHLCSLNDRDFSACKFTFSGTAVSSPEYNPGLGQIVKNNYHKSEILKQKNLHEVGNDFGGGEKMQTHFETRKKEEIAKNWEKD